VTGRAARRTQNGAFRPRDFPRTNWSGRRDSNPRPQPCSACRADAGCREARADRRACAQLGSPAMRPLAMPGPKIDRPRIVSAERIRVSTSEMVGGLFRAVVDWPDGRADADDHRQRQNLDAAGDHVAEHLLGEKGSAAEESKGHEHEAGERAADGTCVWSAWRLTSPCRRPDRARLRAGCQSFGPRFPQIWLPQCHLRGKKGPCGPCGIEIPLIAGLLNCSTRLRSTPRPARAGLRLPLVIELSPSSGPHGSGYRRSATAPTGERARSSSGGTSCR
jgi:hypothetical protein